jgi:HK97 family phage portal protein
VTAVQAAASPFSENSPTPPYGWPSGWPEASTALDAPVSRAEALAVPALSRAVDLMATTVASMPVEHVVIDPEGRRRRTPLTTFMEQPEAARPRYATLVDTCRDLILDGVAYWIVRERYADGFPRVVTYAPVTDVSVMTNDYGDATRVQYRGRDVAARDVIAFQGWNDGIRNHGARIIRTALALEGAARRYADTPLPSLIVNNTSNYELNPTEIAELLDGVKRARQSSAVGYVNGGVQLDTLGWDAKELQLVEARVFTNAAIANLCGIPAHFIAASNVGGSSLTYANASQEARTLIDYGLKPIIATLEARLGMNTVTPRGHIWRFEMDAMLRGNPMERSQLYHSLIPLGVLTVEEAREWEDLTPHAETHDTPPTPTPEGI